MWIILASFFVSILTCALLVFTKNKHLSLTGAGADTAAVQASHTAPTPRIGGVAVMAGMVTGAGLAWLQGQHLYMIVLLTALPTFLTGLAEDLFRHISTKFRYLATAFSALIAVLVLDIWITTADSYVLEWAFYFTPVAVGVTLFVVASYCHAFNLIDGLNGLASGTAILIAAGLAVIGMRTGLDEVVVMSAITAAAVGGFFAFNYPFGRIFLGDGGAYIIGYMLTWTALITLHFAPQTSTWAMFLLFFWPLADTLFAIWRRRSRGVSLDTADRLHYHQLVLRGLEIMFLGRNRRDAANPIATSVMLPFIALPIITGVVFWNNSLAAFVSLVLFGVAFVWSYRLGVAAAQARVRRPKTRIHQHATPAE